VLLFKTDCQRLAGLFKRDRAEEAGRPQFNFEATKLSEVERPDLQLPKGTNANHLWGVRTIHDQKPERQYFEGNCSLLLVCFAG